MLPTELVIIIITIARILLSYFCIKSTWNLFTFGATYFLVKSPNRPLLALSKI